MLKKKSRTKKIYSEDIKYDVIEMINIVIQNDQMITNIYNLSDLNNMFYAAQKTYEDVTKKTKIKSVWKESIEKKIKELDDQLNVLKDLDINKNVSKEVKKVCKKLKIHSNDQQIEKAKDVIMERINVHKKKLMMNDKRNKFRSDNRRFEFNRKCLYRSLDDEVMDIDPNIDLEETKEYWQNIWKANDAISDPEVVGFRDELLSNVDPASINIEITNEILTERIESTIKYLPNWKAPGHDQVYNFFIKHIKALHKKMALLIVEAINDPNKIDDEFYSGVTYLIAKRQNASLPNQLRPITCLPNLYKVISKVVSSLLADFCETNKVISENQAGTRRRCQGAKQQALVNKNLNRFHNNDLKTCWIDAKKAFDSVPHQYLLECLMIMNVPSFIIEFVKRMMKLQPNGWKNNDWYGSFRQGYHAR